MVPAVVLPSRPAGLRGRTLSRVSSGSHPHSRPPALAAASPSRAHIQPSVPRGCSWDGDLRCGPSWQGGRRMAGILTGHVAPTQRHTDDAAKLWPTSSRRVTWAGIGKGQWPCGRSPHKASLGANPFPPHHPPHPGSLGPEPKCSQSPASPPRVPTSGPVLTGQHMPRPPAWGSRSELWDAANRTPPGPACPSASQGPQEGLRDVASTWQSARRPGNSPCLPGPAQGRPTAASCLPLQRLACVRVPGQLQPLHSPGGPCTTPFPEEAPPASPASGCRPGFLSRGLQQRSRGLRVPR